MKFRQLNQAGDTIVEVLIATTILAFVLTGAYESAQYSLNNIINAKNRVSALNIATSQIESLKKIIAVSDTTEAQKIINGGKFYLDSNNAYVANSLGTQIEGGTFYYQFQAPVAYYYPPSSTTPIDDTFTVNVYWRSATPGSINSNCNIGALSSCEVLDLSYQASI